MVTCQLTGGFGNQLCQVSAVIAYARKHAMPLCLPSKTADPSIWPRTWFSDPSIYYNKLWVKAYQERDWIWHQEPENQEYKEIPVYPYVQLRGHFQSYKYWQDYLDEIRYALFPDLTFNNACAVHVRRGDYLKYPVKHPVVTKEYLNAAFTKMREKGVDRFTLFSDDIQWCLEQMNYLNNMLGATVNWRPALDTRKDFIDMMCCEHHIISNSSYSLMAAHLRQNPIGVIIAPASWTLEPKQVWNTDHIIPPGWITI